MKVKDFKSFLSNLFSGSKKIIAWVVVAIIGIVLLLILIMVGAMALFSGFYGESVKITEFSDTYPSYFKADLEAPEGSKGPSFVPSPLSESNDIVSQRKIARTGSLSLLVEKAEEAVNKIKDVVLNKGGFVEALNVYESDYFGVRTSAKIKRAEMTIRIPDEEFENAIKEFKTLVIKVENENINASDVTDQAVDMEARLKNLKAEEAQYQFIMKKAEKIEDILNVTSRLSDVRGRIESLQAQLDNLNKRVSMSTITLSLRSEAGLGVVGDSWRPWSVAKEAFQNLLSGLTEYVDSAIRFIIKLPLYLIKITIWLAIIWLFWRLFMWTKNKLV